MTVEPHEILEAWDVSAREFRRPEQGWNNIVWIVDERYVLRIYQNLDAERVAAEHRLLRGITDARPPFAVPVPIRTVDGHNTVPTPQGPAALYELLPGRPARSDDPRDLELIGAALGDLMTTLGSLPHELAPVEWPRSLGGIHPAVPDVADLVGELETVAANASGLGAFAHHWESIDAYYRVLALPAQICHLDYAASNVLIDGGRVSAILDFEVAGFNLRVADFVAGLLQSTGDAEQEQVFTRAFRSRMDLLPEEWAAVPRVRSFRTLATAIWRAGRWREGKSTLDDVLMRLADVAPPA